MDVEVRGPASSQEPRLMPDDHHHRETPGSASTAAVVRVEPSWWGWIDGRSPHRTLLFASGTRPRRRPRVHDLRGAHARSASAHCVSGRPGESTNKEVTPVAAKKKAGGKKKAAKKSSKKK